VRIWFQNLAFKWVNLCCRYAPATSYHLGSQADFAAYQAAGAPDTTAVLRDDAWVGPVKSTALDAGQKVWYVGGAMVDDRKVFVRDVLLKPGEAVQRVHDLGDRWSHTVVVEAETPEDALNASSRVAHVLSGAGACPPDDCGGLIGYCNKLLELLGLRPMDDGVTGDRSDDDYDSDVEGSDPNSKLESDPTLAATDFDGVHAMDPTKRAFWRHLNLNFRGQKNWMLQGDEMAVGFAFNLAGARRRLGDALRAGRASAAESKRGFISNAVGGGGAGLQAQGANKPERAVEDSDRCAVCGVGLALFTTFILQPPKIKTPKTAGM
jgi:hypothetical protein